MVTDKEIASCVESLLRQAGPAAGAASVDAIVRQLEAKLGLDLSHKALFIRDQIHLLLGPVHHPQHLPQFHPYATAQPYASLPGCAPSPFAHLPHHHDLAFRPPPPVAVAATNQHQQQLMQHPHVAFPRPEGSVGALSPAALRPIASSPKESAPAPAKRRGGPGGLSKVCGVSPELQAIVGEPTMARTQIVKQLWAYIRKNNLQDPNNKRKIICNNELRLVFETDCTDMFKMNKLLAKHIIPLETTNQAPDSKRAKTESSEVASETKPDVDQCAVVISDALATFFGTEEKEMLQSEALKRIWDYIKENQLEEATNSMMVLCDSKLQQLFGCESLSASGISEMLAQHLIKQS
ncbi:putative transcription regulator SWI/SNF-BAF60b family [Dioscorea sansibarensis]